MPGGPLLVGLAGFGLIVGAGYAVYRGVTRAFVRELDLRGAHAQQARLAVRLGRSAGSRWGSCTGFPG